MKSFKKIGLVFLIIVTGFSTAIKAQDISDSFSFNASLKNMHLWKGYKVSDNALTTVNASYTSPDNFFTGGLWYGSSFNGSFTEFDYFVAFNLLPNLNLSIWDINNFSDYPDADIFDYDKETTSHFIDVTLAYQPTSRLGLKWSTIVLGRDTYVDDDGDVKSAFSNYAEVNYVLLDTDDLKIGAFVGGGFSFLNEEHFYGDEPNIVNIGLSASRSVTIFGSTHPISATAMWNPEQEYGAMELSFGLF